MEVDLFVPCFIDQIYPDTASNTVKILEKCGVEVNYNPEQTCCGQPSYNSGYWKETRRLAEKFIRDFSGDRIVVSPSASCTGFIRNYYSKLFEGSDRKKEIEVFSSRFFELTDYLVNTLKAVDLGAVFPHKVTYHSSCSSLREYRLGNAPRLLLDKVKGLELVEMENAETCCGFGGTFMAKFTAISSAMAQQKIENALAAGAEYIISTDSSCLMNLEGYIKKNNVPIKTIHIADILASGWE